MLRPELSFGAWLPVLVQQRRKTWQSSEFQKWLSCFAGCFCGVTTRIAQIAHRQDNRDQSNTPAPRGPDAHHTRTPTTIRSAERLTACLDSSVGRGLYCVREGRHTLGSATSGGESVWRRVLTRGTAPGSVRERVALKAPISKNSAPQSGQAPTTTPSRSPAHH